MPKIEISSSATASLTPPASGSLLFSDSGNNDNISAMDSNGVVFDLTATGGSTGGGGGVFAPTEITHADLLVARDGSALIEGDWYKVTDYASRNFLHGQTNFNEDELLNQIHTSPVEPLYVQALATDKVSGVAYSQDYPQDIIYYNIDDTAVKQITFSDGTLTLQFDGGLNKNYIDLPGDMLTGEYVYMYVEWNGGSNSVDAEWSPLLTGVTEAASTDWGTDTSTITLANGGTRIYFDDLNLAITSDYIYIDYATTFSSKKGSVSRRIDTINNVDIGIDFRNVKYRRYEYDLSTEVTNIGTGYFGHKVEHTRYGKINTTLNATAPGNFQDVYMFYNSKDLLAPPDSTWSVNITNLKIGSPDNIVFVRGNYNPQVMNSTIGVAINATIMSLDSSYIGRLGNSSGGNGMNFISLISHSTIGQTRNILSINISGSNIGEIREATFKGGISRSILGLVLSSNFDFGCSTNNIRYITSTYISGEFSWNECNHMSSNTLNCKFIRNIISSMSSNTMTCGSNGMGENIFTRFDNNTIVTSSSFQGNTGYLWYSNNITAGDIIDNDIYKLSSPYGANINQMRNNTGNEVTDLTLGLTGDILYNTFNVFVNCTINGTNFRSNTQVGIFRTGATTARTFTDATDAVLGQDVESIIYTPANSQVRIRYHNTSDVIVYSTVV